MGASLRTRRFVEFSDTDMAGIVHFTAFFHYMESAEHELLRHLGLNVHTIDAGHAVSFPRVSASCDFLAPARYEDTLDIDVCVLRVGEKSITYEIEISRDDTPIARGTMTSVCCRVSPDAPPKSIPLPQSVADVLRAESV